MDDEKKPRGRPALDPDRRLVDFRRFRASPSAAAWYQGREHGRGSALARLAVEGLALAGDDVAEFIEAIATFCSEPPAETLARILREATERQHVVIMHDERKPA